jgi:SpoVK/Ycf46/Vps4 family AAA+-type ATPase
VAFDVEKPTTEEQASAWTQALSANADDLPGMLTAQFNLNLATIQHIAAGELSEQANQQTPLTERLWDACLLSARPSLDMLAQRLALKVTWDDLVLPAEETDILHQIAAQVQQRNTVYELWGFADKMNRGLGINALFAGTSGTGKTMAAEVIANSLRLNLYRIDLSAVVSKYIGETEKNLRRLFDAAEDGGAILFFDEADALFGKRSEVKDSHDRYANIEINYLLQRIEAYRGLAILATNLRSALDTAFLRRLRFVVTFPFPGIAERKRIWEKVFPPDAPLGTLDFDRLARLELTGGSTHNVALNAAFVAAHAGSKVTMTLVLNAARAEFRKLERPINEADFRLPVVQGANA